jgi:hypothetical protein
MRVGVMSFRVHNDRVVVIEGPVGYKRTWWFPANGDRQERSGVEGREGRGLGARF